MRDGTVQRLARGRYALPTVGADRRLAVELSAVLSHRSAALALGLSVATLPDRTELIVPRGRAVSSAAHRRAAIRWRTVSERERREGMTDPLTTVVDCLRNLSPEESVAVLDSALNHRLVTVEEVRREVVALRGPGSARARRTAPLGDGRADNPFETRLRLIGRSVEALELEPQVPVWCGARLVRVDLADASRGIVAEADSFRWHGSRSALEADCRRYDELTAHGWVVLRFAWEQVFGHSEWVRGVLAQAVACRPVQPCGPWVATLAPPWSCPA